MFQRIGNRVIPGGKVQNRRPEPAVKRAVDGNHASAAIGHHDGDTFAFRISCGSQPCRESARAVTQLAPAERGYRVIKEAKRQPIALRALGAIVQPAAHSTFGWRDHCPALAQ